MHACMHARVYIYMSLYMCVCHYVFACKCVRACMHEGMHMHLDYIATILHMYMHV